LFDFAATLLSLTPRIVRCGDKYRLLDYWASMSTTVTGDEFRRLRHDIKGCLNSLVLSVEVLGENLEPDEAIDFIDGLQRAADKLATLVDQLPYDQIQSGQLPLPAQAPKH
jgi:signal transduction histidine kinase